MTSRKLANPSTVIGSTLTAVLSVRIVVQARPGKAREGLRVARGIGHRVGSDRGNAAAPGHFWPGRPIHEHPSPFLNLAGRVPARLLDLGPVGAADPNQALTAVTGPEHRASVLREGPATGIGWTKVQ